MKYIEINNKNNGLVDVSFKADNNLYHYILQGRSNLFNYEFIDESSNNAFTISSFVFNMYLDFRVVCIKEDSNVIEKYIYSDRIDEVNIHYHCNINNNSIVTSIIGSYKGFSVSFYTKELYDLYLLYEYIDGDYKLLIQSDDFQVTSNILKYNHKYYVEAFNIIDNNYIMVNKSNIFVCKSKDINNYENDFTIGIPVYNGEFFLPRTIDSIILSNINNYNIILCNDGSSDNTKNICKWYEKKYSFIKFIDKGNTGVSDTRNVILDNINTNYMAFIDADDIVHPDMYKLLYKNIIEKNLDVSIAKTLIKEDKKDNCFVLNIKNDDGYSIYNYEDMFKEYDKNSVNNIYFVAVWNKIVRTDIAKKVRFPDWNYYEDSAYTASIYSYADKFGFVCDALYVWDKRKRASIGTYSSSYNKLDFKNVVDTYFKSTIYPIYNCNINNKDYVIYQAIKELINYNNNISSYSNNEDVIEFRKRIVSELRKIDINNNLFISNKSLYDSINKLMDEYK